MGNYASHKPHVRQLADPVDPANAAVTDPVVPAKAASVETKRVLKAAEIKSAVRYLLEDVGKYVEDGPDFNYVEPSGRTFLDLVMMFGNRLIVEDDEVTHFLREFFLCSLETLDQNGGHTNRKHVTSSNRQVWDRVEFHTHRQTTASSKFTRPRVAELSILCVLCENCKSILLALDRWVRQKNTAYQEWQRLRNQLTNDFAEWEVHNVDRLAPARRRQFENMESQINLNWRNSQTDFGLMVRSELGDVNVGYGYVGLKDNVTVRRSFSGVRVQLVVKNGQAGIMTAYPDDAFGGQWEQCSSDNILQRFGMKHHPVIMLIPVYFDADVYWGKLETVAAAEGKGVVWSGWETFKLGAEAKQALQEKPKETEVKIVDPSSTATATNNVVPGNLKQADAVPQAMNPISAQRCVEGQTASAAVKTGASPNVVKESKQENIATPPAITAKESQSITANSGKEVKQDDKSTLPAEAAKESQATSTTEEQKAAEEKEIKKKTLLRAEALIENIALDVPQTDMNLLQLMSNEKAAHINCRNAVPGNSVGMGPAACGVNPNLPSPQPEMPGPSGNEIYQHGQMPTQSGGNQPAGNSRGWQQQGPNQTSSFGNAPQPDFRRWPNQERGGLSGDQWGRGPQGGQRGATIRRAGSQQHLGRRESRGGVAGSPRRGNAFGFSSQGAMELNLRADSGHPDRNRLSLSFNNQETRVSVQQEGGLFSPDLLQATQGYQLMSLQHNVGARVFPVMQSPTGGFQEQGGYLEMPNAPAIGWNQSHQQQRRCMQGNRIASSLPAQSGWHQTNRQGSNYNVGRGGNFQSPPGHMAEHEYYGPSASTPMSAGPRDDQHIFGSPGARQLSASQRSLGEHSLQFGSPTSDPASPVYSDEALGNVSSQHSWEYGSGPNSSTSNVGNFNNSGASGNSNPGQFPPSHWRQQNPRN